MTMSCVAERKARITPHKAKRAMWWTGSLAPSWMTATASSACTVNSHARRWPNKRVRPGSAMPSISGAHRNLSVYGVPSAKAKPMVFLSMPILVSQ